MVFRTILGLAILMVISGCATMRGGKDSSQLEMRVAQLERQIQYKDDEIRSLKYELQDLSDKVSAKTVAVTPAPEAKTSVSKASTQDIPGYKQEGIVRMPVSVEQVQTALKNAGFYQGTVDGKLGNQTKSAIAEFQKGHNLNPDGIVGKRTWMEMEKYLE